MGDRFNSNAWWILCAIAAALAAALWARRRSRSRRPADSPSTFDSGGPPRLTLEFSHPEFHDVPARSRFVSLRNDGGLARDVQVGAISVGPYRAIFSPVPLLGGGETLPLRLEVYEEGQLFASPASGFENLLRHNSRGPSSILRLNTLISFRDGDGSPQTTGICINCDRPSMRLWVTPA